MVTNVTKEWLLGESGTDGANANVGITGVGSGSPKYHNTNFPAGMIVQVKKATLSDILATTDGHSSETILYKANGQITITSGNKVYIQCMSFPYSNGSSNSVGEIKIREGLTTSGTILSRMQWGDGTGAFHYCAATLWGFDDSPASTTPDYCVTIVKASGNTTSVQNASTDLTYNQMIFFEIAG